MVRSGAPGAEYVAAPENLGPAGGIALGMARLLERAGDDDWIVTLDDDDPPGDPGAFADLLALAIETSERDRSTAAVGLSGVRFDRRRGRVVRVPDDELHDAVAVDSIAGNQCPCYAVRAIRAVGTMRTDLFFGHEELELGLRLGDAGYSLYGHGARWHDKRVALGRLDMDLVPSRSLGDPTWRRYYSLRNLVRILRERGTAGSALRVTVVAGIGKPLANLVREPRLALAHLRLNVRACRDGWTGRMGRTVEPVTDRSEPGRDGGHHHPQPSRARATRAGERARADVPRPRGAGRRRRVPAPVRPGRRRRAGPRDPARAGRRCLPRPERRARRREGRVRHLPRRRRHARARHGGAVGPGGVVVDAPTTGRGDVDGDGARPRRGRPRRVDTARDTSTRARTSSSSAGVRPGARPTASSFPTDVLRAIGGWDESLEAFQHDDLGLRLNAVASIEGLSTPLYRMSTHRAPESRPAGR